MGHSFKRPMAILGGFCGGNTEKLKHNLQNIYKYDKNNLTNSFVKKPSHVF